MGKQKKAVKKEYHLSNEQTSELARLVTGQYLANTEAAFIARGYQETIADFISRAEKGLSIDRKEVDVDWASALKDGRIYTFSPKRPVDEPAVEVGSEEKREDVQDQDTQD
jgi:hypothetical protein